MTQALVLSRALLGLGAPRVQVEAHLPSGLPGFVTTGISGSDLRDRVKAAIQNSAFSFHSGRIVVNLGPAELAKSGPRYDLAIAAAVLTASDELPADALRGYELLGELSLFGDVRGVRGVLSAAREATRAGRTLLCPAANGPEFAGAEGLRVKLIGHLNELAKLPALSAPTHPTTHPQTPGVPADGDPLSEVIGQEQAKRALTIAAAGGHHLLFKGPPGAGKTMLAERLRSLLPPLQAEARATVAEIYSLSGLARHNRSLPPFRAPHHSASAAGLAGGGSPPGPGEISHAHMGVLFLDEMPEFRRDALEALREPLESGQIRLSRRGITIAYPARFQLVAAMNPCPQGRVCTPTTCRCSAEQAMRYQARISAPILDRIDLHVTVTAVPIDDLLTARPATASRPELNRTGLVRQARRLQLQRSGCLNAALTQSQIETLCTPPADVKRLLVSATKRLALSARGYFRTLRVARTIADLACLEQQGAQALDAQPDTVGSVSAAADLAAPQIQIDEAAVTEALGYRALDTPY